MACETLFQKQLDIRTTVRYTMATRVSNMTKKTSGSRDTLPFMGTCSRYLEPLLPLELAMICPERIAVKEVGQTLEIDNEGIVWEIGVKRDGHVFPHIKKIRAKYSFEGLYLEIRVKVGYTIISTAAHRLVYQYFFGDIPDGFVIHHKNKNRRDNNPDNLQAIKNVEHLRLYRKKRVSWKQVLKAYKEHCKELDYKLQLKKKEK